MIAAHGKRNGDRLGRRSDWNSPQFRRTRTPRLESLEDRTLLATLQFSGGLGEISTLDSAVQILNSLSDVNTPHSQQFTHNDGTAVSNVTLKSAASTTGNPGVNLDILSQGSVAKKGPSSVAVNTGVTGTSGSIGFTVSIPVTIVATDPLEYAGEGVNVRLDSVFNVRTFASNYATAVFVYAASYTYEGTTTPVASHLYDLGGSGITPTGSGPMNDQTATLHAKIGDTFSVSLSENLVGQTIAPFSGALTNNVGWLVDNTLDFSIGSPFATSTSIDSGPTPSVYGQTVTFGAQIKNLSPENTDPPTGRVKFFVDGAAFGMTPVNADGAALIADNTLPVGNHKITAEYAPDGEDFASSKSQIPALQHVDFAATRTTIDSEPNPSLYGQTVTFGAQVANIEQESTAEPTGDVQFYIEGATFGVPVPLMPNGTALVTDDRLSLGTHQISAAFLPADATFAASMSETPVTQIVNQPMLLNTTLQAVSGNGSDKGPATLTATLSAAGGALAGKTIDFTVYELGKFTSIGSAVTNASGVATLSGVNLLGFNAGSFSNFVEAQFAGDSVYAGSSADGTLTVVVGNYVEITSSPTSQVASAGNPVTLMAAGAGLPDPTVQWQVETTGGSTFSNIAGAVSRTLTFIATPADNGNEYRAVFANAAGSVTTAAADLTVTTQPSSLVVSSTSTGLLNLPFAEPSYPGALYFGAQVLALSTGNIVMTDPGGVGAAFLYNGQTGGAESAACSVRTQSQHSRTAISSPWAPEARPGGAESQA